MSDHDELPNRSNFFATLATSLSKEQVAQLYGNQGWLIRKCSWDDFEVHNSWAELVIDGDSPILLHGPVARGEENAVAILLPLQDAGISYRAECYGEADEILEEYEWPDGGA